MNLKSCKHQPLSPLLALFLSIGVLLSTDTLAAVSQVQLAAERNARINADTTLTTNLAAEQNARIAADTTETKARIEGDHAEAVARHNEILQAIEAALATLEVKIGSYLLPHFPSAKYQASLTLCGNSDTPQWGPCHYAIGDTGPAGGIVFYVTSGGMHGLEAAPVDQGNALWDCQGASIAGATGTAVGTGAANTAAIVAGCAVAGTAAKVADAYSLNGYDDWFLPSKDELNLMYTKIGPGATASLTNVGGFANVYYWSSTEFDANFAWGQDFIDGFQGTGTKNDTLRVRAVRAF